MHMHTAWHVHVHVHVHVYGGCADVTLCVLHSRLDVWQIHREQDSGCWMLRYYDGKNSATRVEKGCIMLTKGTVREINKYTLQEDSAVRRPLHTTSLTPQFLGLLLLANSLSCVCVSIRSNPGRYHAWACTFCKTSAAGSCCLPRRSSTCGSPSCN